MHAGIIYVFQIHIFEHTLVAENSVDSRNTNDI